MRLGRVVCIGLVIGLCSASAARADFCLRSDLGFMAKGSADPDRLQMLPDAIAPK